MIYYVVFLGLMTLENIREVLTVEYSTSFINNLNKTKQSDQEHISDQIQRNFQHITEADQENEGKQIFNMNRRQKTEEEEEEEAKKRDDSLIFDTSRAPYFVVIEVQHPDRKLKCAGTILSNCHVLTVAHCVSTRTKEHPPGFQILDNKQIKIFSGVSENPDHDTRAKGVWIHPHYLLRPEVELYRDIAVVQTLKIMIYSPTTQTVHIHPNLHIEDLSQVKKCSVVDWSSIERRSIGLTMVTLISNKECKAMMKDMMDEQVHVCVLDVDFDICNAESGLGLLCEGMLLAVMSWGIRVGSDTSSGCVYARVDNALDFILPVLDNEHCKAAFFSPTLTTLLNLILLHFTQY